MDTAQFSSELEALNGELKTSTSVGVGNFQSSSAEDWNKVFGEVTPKLLYNRFTKAAGSVPIRIHVLFPEDAGLTRIKIRHDSLFHQGHERENEVRLDIRPDRPPKLDGIFLKYKDQSKNIAKRYLRTAVDLLKDIGADSMELEAIEVGAYSWAKYGFTPATPEDWNGLKAQIRQRLKGDGETLAFGSKRYDVSLEKPAIDKILNTEFADLPKAFPQLTELNREIGEHNERPLTVGKALLIGTKWNAQLPFDEQHISFQRFNSYTDAATKDLQLG